MCAALHVILFITLLFWINGSPNNSSSNDLDEPEEKQLIDDDVLQSENGHNNQLPENQSPENSHDDQPPEDGSDGQPAENGSDDQPAEDGSDGQPAENDLISPRLVHRDVIDLSKPEPGFDLTQEEIDKFKLWSDAMIPYYIDVPSFSDKVLRDKITSYLSSVNSMTSLNFIELHSPPKDDSRYVIFINRRGRLGCADHSIKNFTNSGVQRVVLGYHCLSTGGELAEAVLTIAGVPPMHNAPDRDDHINVNEDNIMPDKKYLFQKLKDNQWLFHDLDYDFKSVGHYRYHKYSKNGRATIELAEPNPEVTLGEATVLSPIDIIKIRMLYNYMVRNKQIQALGCDKLFEPGSKFSHFKPNMVEPRKKPSKYEDYREEDDEPEESDEGVKEVEIYPR